MSEELPDYIGHRQRLKERFKLGGGGDMADYEMLELLLTLAIPRKIPNRWQKRWLRNSAVLPKSCLLRTTN